MVTRNRRDRECSIRGGQKEFENCGRGGNRNHGKQNKEAIKESQVIEAVGMSTRTKYTKRMRVDIHMKNTNQVAHRPSILSFNY